jgi:hypothetical protein
MKRNTADHPKTLALMAALNVPKYAACGLLELLWHQFTVKYAPQGDVGRWADAQIAAGVSWDGEPGVLISALVKAGWLDEHPKHRLVVHDWPDHAEDAVHKTLARSCQRFASGAAPKLAGLNSEEKARAAAAYATPAADGGQSSPSVVSGDQRPPTATEGDFRPPAVAVALAVATPEPQPPPDPGPPPVAVGGQEAAGPPADYVPVEQLTCPDCKRRAVVRQLEAYADRDELGRIKRAPGWVCSKRRGGCGTLFDVGTRQLLEQLPDPQRQAVARSVERLEGPPAPARDEAARIQAEEEALEDLAQLLAQRYHESPEPVPDAESWLARERVPSPGLLLPRFLERLKALEAADVALETPRGPCSHAPAYRHLKRNPHAVVVCPDCGEDIRSQERSA